MTDKEIKKWVKERDAVILTRDVQKFKEFYAKWQKKGLYQMPLPKNDVVVRASMEKAILGMAYSTEQDKAEAKVWLLGHGFKPEF